MYRYIYTSIKKKKIFINYVNNLCFCLTIGRIHLPIVTNINYKELIFVILLYKSLICRIDYTTGWKSIVCT